MIEQIANTILQDAEQLVTEKAKTDLFNYVYNKGFGTLKDVADAYCTALKTSADNSTGWVYIRDKFFVPTVISLSVSILGGLMEQIANNTKEG